MAEYLTPSELLLYTDERRVRGLCSDNDTEVTGDLSNNAILATAIRAASAELDSALQVSRRYDRAQLEALCVDSRVPGAPHDLRKRAEAVKSLVAHLAYGNLVSRRGYAAETMTRLAPMYAVAQERIAKLVNGDAIFDLDGPKDAGLPSQETIGSKLPPIGNLPLFAYFPPGMWPGVGMPGDWDRR